MNPLELPEIVALMFDRLPARDVFACLLVCRDWYAEANRPSRWPMITDRGYDIVLNDLKIISYTDTNHKWLSCYISECVIFMLYTLSATVRHYIITPKKHIHATLLAYARKHLRHRTYYAESDDVLFSVYPGTGARNQCLHGDDQALLAGISHCGKLSYSHWTPS